MSKSDAWAVIRNGKSYKGKSLQEAQEKANKEFPLKEPTSFIWRNPKSKNLTE